MGDIHLPQWLTGDRAAPPAAVVPAPDLIIKTPYGHRLFDHRTVPPTGSTQWVPGHPTPTGSGYQRLWPGWPQYPRLSAGERPAAGRTARCPARTGVVTDPRTAGGRGALSLVRY
eukprot:755909-Hanusia_phi.AAC.1